MSAWTGEGLDQLRARIADHFAHRFELVELLVPYSEGSKLAELYALGPPIESRTDREDGVLIRARLRELALELLLGEARFLRLQAQLVASLAQRIEPLLGLQHRRPAFRAALAGGPLAASVRVSALVSALLWLSVLVAGRWIGFL